MPELERSERKITIYCNPDRPSAPKTLGNAKDEGFVIQDINIITNKIISTQLEELASKLKVTLEDLVNKDHPNYDAVLRNSNFSNEDCIKVILKNPKFIKEPIAIRARNAMFVKTPSDLSRL